MARFLFAITLTLPVAAALVVPALAQQQLSPPGLYDERLPPIMYDDDDNLPGTPGAKWRTKSAPKSQSHFSVPRRSSGRPAASRAIRVTGRLWASA